MPIHSAGYRSWEGQLTPASLRSLVIATTGIRRTSKSKWLRRMLFFAMLPTLVLAVPFFLFEQGLRDPQMARDLGEFLGGMQQSQAIGLAVEQGLANATPEQAKEMRHQVWSLLLLTLFRYPQAVLMVLVVGIAAPPLISHDVRSRAFMIYFSRPIERWEYVIGKLGTVTFFLAMITTLPAFVLYIAGVMLSPSLSVVLETWDLPLRILVASIVLSLPTASMALMFSSMTTESRYAAFAWFAVWILGNVAFSTVMAFAVAAQRDVVEPGWRTMLSPYHTLGVVQAWIFDLEPPGAAVAPSMVALVAITIGSLILLFHRVSLPIRA